MQEGIILIGSERSRFSIGTIGCVVNVKRCGRLHCYVTGPIFLLAAVYVMLAEGNIAPLRPNLFALVILGVAVLACFAELPFGRYVTRT